MPKPFLDCIAKGGKVRTVSLPKGTYRHVCYLKGKSYAGEVKKAQSPASKGGGST